MIPLLTDPLRRRLSWSIFSLACLAFLMLGIAEQGAHGSAVQTPPPSPLPFARDRVLGLDLRNYSSLDALEWLHSAEVGSLPLIALPIDGDVVSAFGQPEVQDSAVGAIDQLVQAGTGSPLAICLRQPSALGTPPDIAVIAIEAILERYPNVIAYVSACDPKVNEEWQQTIASAMQQINRRVAASTATLIPVSTGAALDIVQLDSIDAISDVDEIAPPASGYLAIAVPISAPITEQNVSSFQSVIVNGSHTAIILAQPASELPPEFVTPAFGLAPVATSLLLDGFSNVTSGFVLREGEWQESTVGTVTYLRSSAESSTLVVDFVGTEVYLIGVRSPSSGRISAWIDPDLTGEQPRPDLTIEMVATQARDAAIPLFTGLPATRHRLYVVAQNDSASSVTVSGFFVSSRPTPVWSGLLAALGLLAVAVASLAERCYASVVAIRRANSTRTDPEQEGHPRGFRRLR